MELFASTELFGIRTTFLVVLHCSILLAAAATTFGFPQRSLQLLHIASANGGTNLNQSATSREAYK